MAARDVRIRAAIALLFIRCLFHQVMHVERDRALESGGVHFLVQALLFQKAFKTASPMLVLISCCF